ncbi:MAG TPA: hypothetical protein VN808_18085 [Stellaceae bacterium]|nr:hypothetical protein [Stellaceae bacterium]
MKIPIIPPLPAGVAAQIAPVGQAEACLSYLSAYPLVAAGVKLIEEPLFKFQFQQLVADPQMRSHLPRVPRHSANADAGSYHR